MVSEMMLSVTQLGSILAGTAPTVRTPVAAILTVVYAGMKSDGSATVFCGGTRGLTLVPHFSALNLCVVRRVS
jgi:hypothetical protein